MYYGLPDSAPDGRDGWRLSVAATICASTSPASKARVLTFSTAVRRARLRTDSCRCGCPSTTPSIVNGRSVCAPLTSSRSPFRRSKSASAHRSSPDLPDGFQLRVALSPRIRIRLGTKFRATFAAAWPASAGSGRSKALPVQSSRTIQADRRNQCLMPGDRFRRLPPVQTPRDSPRFFSLDPCNLSASDSREWAMSAQVFTST